MHLHHQRVQSTSLQTYTHGRTSMPRSKRKYGILAQIRWLSCTKAAQAQPPTESKHWLINFSLRDPLYNQMLKAIVIGVAATVLLLSLMESHTGAVHFKEESLKGRLNIYRDEQGLARVVADNREDLFYGVGWASAQDRLFTLHEKRMFLEGRMSEMFGDATLPLDRYLRNINLFGIGQANDKLTDNETRSYLEAYVRGINDYADSLKIWPLDFYVLWTTWEPFTTAHSHAMVALFSLTLEFDWMFEIARERLKETVGLDLAAKLIPSCSEDLFQEVTIVKDDELKELGLFKQYPKGEFKKIIKEHWGKLDLSLPAFNSPHLSYSGAASAATGSNAWVIGRKHSAKNRTLLANDPHLGMTIPSIFYPIEMVIVDKNNDIVDQAFGVMSDGLPGISMGKNQYFAWGSTSLYADSKDVFVETVRENDQGIKEYFYENQWLPLKIREEVFSVRGSGTYTDIYYETHRGPLLSSIFMDIHLKYGFPISKHHQKMLSLEIAAAKPDSGRSVKGLLAGIFAKDVKSFEQAGGLMEIVNIDSVFASRFEPDYWGFSPLGRIPKRNIPEMGSYVKNGTTSLYNQLEYLTQQQKPSLRNPKRGYVAMTNNKFASDNYVHRASIHEISNGRASRLQQIITEGIKEEKKFTIEDMMAMQQDTKDVFVEKIMFNLTKILRDNRADWVDTEFAEKVIQWFEAWDFHFDRNKFEPSIYTVWEHEFQKLLLVDKGLSDEERIAITNHAFFEIFYFNLIRRLSADNTTNQEDKLLCSNDLNAGSTKNPCIVNIIIAFNKLQNSLNEWFKTLDHTQWKWGTIHKKSFTFVPWTEIPVIGRFFNRKIPAHGNSRTLNVGIHSYQKKNFQTFATAIFRFVTDFNRTFYSIDMGVTDRVTSKFYDNFLHDFNDGKYVEYKEINPLKDNHNWNLVGTSLSMEAETIANQTNKTDL